MEIKISHTSYVINFFDIIDIELLSQEYENILNHFFKDFMNVELPKWKIDFVIVYRNGENIIVSKKSKASLKDKIKEIYVHIPIPSNEEVHWGVRSADIVKIGVGQDASKFVNFIKVNWSDSDSLESHVKRCIEIGISFSFNDGFTIMGNKIQYKDKIFDFSRSQWRCKK